MFIGSLVATVAVTIPLNNIWFSICTTVVFTIGYALKNAWIPSNSPEGKIGTWDVISGVLIAVMMAASELIAQYVTGVHLTAQMFWVAISGALVTYFAKTIPQGSRS